MKIPKHVYIWNKETNKLEKVETNPDAQNQAQVEFCERGHTSMTREERLVDVYFTQEEAEQALQEKKDQIELDLKNLY